LRRPGGDPADCRCEFSFVIAKKAALLLEVGECGPGEANFVHRVATGQRGRHFAHDGVVDAPGFDVYFVERILKGCKADLLQRKFGSDVGDDANTLACVGLLGGLRKGRERGRQREDEGTQYARHNPSSYIRTRNGLCL